MERVEWVKVGHGSAAMLNYVRNTWSYLYWYCGILCLMDHSIYDWHQHDQVSAITCL